MSNSSPQQVTGIAGSHQSPQQGATTARTSSKTSWWKGGLWLGVLLVVILLLFWWKSLPAGWFIAKFETTTNQPQVGVKTATWEKKVPDGTLPVGIWSETIEMPERCGISFSDGYGAVYVAQYQYYSTEWKELIMGEHKPMNKFRYKMVKAGETSRPYTIECKPRPY